MTTYGYVRVSTKEQNEARQNLALWAHGIPPERIFLDKQSGKDFDRPAYQQLLRRLRPGDLLCIKSIDRLGRDYEEIQSQWRVLTKEKGIDIVVLDMPLLDTRKGKDLLGTFVSDMVLQVLSFVAENERTNIRQRQAEGIKAARLAGKRMGRPSQPLPAGFEEAAKRWADGEISYRKAAFSCGMTPGNFRYHALKWRESYESTQIQAPR
jgi:DNA invertase Pin-like site-specific DNA recombinase